jgi:hypothetical protein
MELFGYQITKKIASREGKLDKDLKSFVPKRDDEGSSSVVTTGGYYGQYVDVDGTSNDSENELIVKYREAASQPECDQAINDIVDGAIASGDDSAPADLNMNDSELPDSIKKQIQEEFKKILSLYKFNRRASDLFKEWYIDGRLYFHVVTDEKNFNKGIKELRQINPLYLKKVKEIKKILDQKTGVKIPKVVAEYYIYSESSEGGDSSSGIKIAREAIVSCPSGLLDINQEKVISHLHKSMKLVNQLRMMEDSLVMYRVSRAPERRIFYIDVGNLPKGKAEEYVQSVMSKYRNKLVYDSSTGEIRDDRRHMSMLEDFYMPRREGGRGTEITTLPGGENLGQIDDVVFFQKKLYKALNVPVARLEQDTGYAFGRPSEVSRDEVKFQKFIDKLRKRFSFFLIDALRIQLILKGIIKQSEWETIEESIAVDFVEDNYFSELKESEIIKERIETVNLMDEFVGKYYSMAWVRRNILQQNDDEIERINQEIEDEAKEEGGEDDPDFESVETPTQPENIDQENTDQDQENTDQESETREIEIHEAQLKMIDSMSKILEE